MACDNSHQGWDLHSLDRAHFQHHYVVVPFDHQIMMDPLMDPPI
jgi:hypothetical protein